MCAEHHQDRVVAMEEHLRKNCREHSIGAVESGEERVGQAPLFIARPLFTERGKKYVVSLYSLLPEVAATLPGDNPLSAMPKVTVLQNPYLAPPGSPWAVTALKDGVYGVLVGKGREPTGFFPEGEKLDDLIQHLRDDHPEAYSNVAMLEQSRAKIPELRRLEQERNRPN